MEFYPILLVGGSALILLTAWLPLVLKNAPLSLPIVCVCMGAALVALPGVPAQHPQHYLPTVERLTEFVVIVSLMGAGLKIDRVIGWRGWMITWRLLGFSMPITIALAAMSAYWLLGIGIATALLLAAVLAPTDPVLASDIQVGPPGSGEEDETRFALTSEAGLNDGLAFPFVHAAILISAASLTGEAWFGKWLSYYVVWKLGVGIALGCAIGLGLGWLTFHLPHRAKLSRTGDGFVALAITGLAYGMTELAHGYGFVGVFVAALCLRAAARNHEYQEKLHDFAEQLERLLMMALLVLFGGALSAGGLLQALTWEAAVFGMISVFVIRPLSGWAGLAGTGIPYMERAAISFYGIRGLGSIYYLAFALQKGQFDKPNLLWSALAFIVLLSILLHGATVTPVMKFVDSRRNRKLAEPE